MEIGQRGAAAVGERQPDRLLALLQADGQGGDSPT
jgi:hypothetical protein